MQREAWHVKPLEDPREGISYLEGVNSANITELSKVVAVLHSFLVKISSTDDEWNLLRSCLDKSVPCFLPKIRLTFLYYFSKCLEKQFLDKEDLIHAPKTSKSNLASLRTTISEDADGSRDLYIMFKEMFQDNVKHAGIKSNMMVAEFLEDTFEKQADLLGLKDGRILPSSMSVTDFFKTATETLKEDDPVEKSMSFVVDGLKSQSCEIQAFCSIFTNILAESAIDGTFRANAGGRLTKIINKISNEDLRTAYHQLVEELNGNVITVDNRKDYLDKLFKLANDINGKLVKKETTEEPDNVSSSMKDLLAMNMADYISGKITAEDFQLRDEKIRSLNSQSLNETII